MASLMPPDKAIRQFKPDLDGAAARPHIKAVMIAQTIETKLTRALDPVDLEIVDESHLHAGHVGARPEGETHFRVMANPASTASGWSSMSSARRWRRVSMR